MTIWDAVLFTLILYILAGNIVAIGFFIDPKNRRKKGLRTGVMAYLLIVVFWLAGIPSIFKKRRF